MPGGVSHRLSRGNGQGVLVTRPEPGLSETVHALTNAGWRAYASSALTIVPTILAPFTEQFAALVLTSGQAIPCACSAVAKTMPVYAVGDRTAQRARAAGFTHVYSAHGNATDLLALVLRERRAGHGRLLLLSGMGQGGALAVQLRGNGFDVAHHVAYAAHPIAGVQPTILSSLQAGHIHYSLFFSAQSAQAWVQALPSTMQAYAAQTTGVAISEATAEVLRQAGWAHVRVAAKPHAAALLALLGPAPLGT